MKVKIYRVKIDQGAPSDSYQATAEAGGDAVQLPEGLYKFRVREYVRVLQPQPAVVSLRFVVNVRTEYQGAAGRRVWFAMVEAADIEARADTPNEAIERAVSALSERYDGVALHIDVRAVEIGS